MAGEVGRDVEETPGLKRGEAAKVTLRHLGGEIGSGSKCLQTDLNVSQTEPLVMEKVV